MDRARDVYKAAIKLVPHKRFTFAKIWVQFAYFELRRQDVNAARKVMGTAIGLCPKERLFKVCDCAIGLSSSLLTNWSMTGVH
jgi:crooked neck